MPRSRWTYSDVVDFEALLASGADERAEPTGATGDRRTVLREWVARESARVAEPLPGERLRAGWQTTALLAAAIGLLSGAGLAAGLLASPGERPINVAWFLAVTVGLQWLLLLAGAAWMGLRRLGGMNRRRPLADLVAGLATRTLRRLPGDRRERARVAWATLTQRNEIYGGLPVLPAAAVLQVLGVAFNLGLLAALLLHVTVRDLAFGWESTLNPNPARVHAVAAALAGPWSFLPDAVPTLTEVRDSRFTPGQPVPDRAAARAWWPFLAATIVTYGLLPRTLLLGLVWLRLRQRLAALPFDHASARALHRRLAGPPVRAGEAGEAPRIPGGPSPAPAFEPPALALVADELPPELLPPSPRLRLDHPSGNAEVLAAVAAAAPAALAIFVPGSRPPIKAIALVLGRVLAAAPGTDARLVVVDATPETLTHWRNFAALNRLDVSVEPAP